jgi:hypothetical protein
VRARGLAVLSKLTTFSLGLLSQLTQKAFSLCRV